MRATWAVSRACPSTTMLSRICPSLRLALGKIHLRWLRDGEGVGPEPFDARAGKKTEQTEPAQPTPGGFVGSKQRKRAAWTLLRRSRYNPDNRTIRYRQPSLSDLKFAYCETANQSF